jgi:choline transporter-like protein 2/4/5
MSPVEKPRKCTDMLCCIIFGVAFIGMFVASFYGYSAGAPWKLIAPIDGDGRICGYYNQNGIDMTEYKHLYIGNVHEALSPLGIASLSIFDYGVCVKECPKEKTEAV